MKKLFLSILLLCLTLSVFAQKNTGRVIIPESNLRFVANEDYTEVTITGFINDKKFAGRVIEIPSQIQGVPVTTIGEGAFQDRVSGINGIYIPDGIKRIGAGAFNGSSFNSIRLPEKLETIEPYTFRSTSFKSITIPLTVKDIMHDAFSECQLESFIIPEGCRLGRVEKERGSDEYFFRGSVLRGSNIKNLVFPNGPIYIYDNMNDYASVKGSNFVNCDSLENIVIPEGLEVVLVSNSEEEYTLADFVSGKKIEASFALQKQLKSVKVRSSVLIDHEEKLDDYNKAFDSGDYKKAAQIAKEFIDAYSSFKRDEWKDRYSLAAYGMEYLNKYNAAFDSGDFEKAMEIAKDFQNTYSYGKVEWDRRYKIAYEKSWINDFDKAFDSCDYVRAMQIANEFREKSEHYKDKEWSDRYALAVYNYEKKYLDDYNRAFNSGDYSAAMKISNEFREESEHQNDNEWAYRYKMALSTYEKKSLDDYYECVDLDWGKAEKIAKEFIDELSWNIRKINDYEQKKKLKDLRIKWEELLHLPLLTEELLESVFFEKEDSGTRFIIILGRNYYDGVSLYFLDSEREKIRIDSDEILKRLSKKTGKDFNVGFGVVKNKSKQIGTEHYLYFSATAKEAAEFEKKLAEDQAAKERAEKQKKYEQAFLNGTLHTNIACNVNGKWSCAIDFSENEGIVSIDGFKVKKSIFEKKGLKAKDVIKKILIKDESGNETELNWKELLSIKSIRAPATLIFSVERGSGKKLQTLTISVPVEWNADEIKKLR